MIIYLLLFYILPRNVSPDPVNASPVPNITSMYHLPVLLGSSNTTLTDSTPVCDCNQRSMLDIIWSCLSTLFLCSWVSVHQNMPAPEDESWRITWRRLKTMYWAIVGPEFVLFWAVRQLLGAKKIYNKYKRLYPGWTMNHAHFLQMGGFQLKNGNEALEVIYPDNFDKLINAKKISFPSITKEEIQDKSKADGLSKIVVSSQTLWFVIQCIGRHTQGLPLAQLEVTTLAVVSSTFLLSIIWWHKPFDARCTVILEHIKNSSVRKENLSPNTEGVLRNLRIPPGAAGSLPLVNVRGAPSSVVDQHIEAIGVSTPNDKTNNSTGRRRCGGCRNLIIAPIATLYSTLSSIILAVYEDIFDDGFLTVIPKILIKSIFFPIQGLLATNDGDEFRAFKTRVPSYFALPIDSYSFTPYGALSLLISASTALFGAIHCISWNSDFPSATEKLLWRISGIGVGAIPALSVAVVYISAFMDGWDILGDSGILMSIYCLTMFLSILSIPTVYVIFRLYLFIESFVSLHVLPPSAFQTISWSDFIPHF